MTIHNADDEDRDLALGAFLKLLEKEIEAGRVREMPAHLLKAMRRVSKEVPVDLDEVLEGDIDL